MSLNIVSRLIRIIEIDNLYFYEFFEKIIQADS